MSTRRPLMLTNKGSRARAAQGITEVSLHRPSLVVFFGILIVVALVTTSPIAYWLLYALGSVIAASYFWTRHTASRLKLYRQLRTQNLSVNDEVEEQFELINDSHLPVLLVEIEDHSDLPGYQASMVESLGAHQSLSLIHI